MCCASSIPKLRIYTARATKKLPTVTVMKDYSIFLSTDPDLHGSSVLKLDAPEMYGFGTGDWLVGEVAGMTSTTLSCSINSQLHAIWTCHAS